MKLATLAHRYTRARSRSRTHTRTHTRTHLDVVDPCGEVSHVLRRPMVREVFDACLRTGERVEMDVAVDVERLLEDRRLVKPARGPEDLFEVGDVGVRGTSRAWISAGSRPNARAPAHHVAWLLNELVVSYLLRR